MTKKDVGTNVWALAMWLYRAVIVGFSGWYTWTALEVFHQWNFVSNFAFLTQVTNAIVFVFYGAWVVRALLNGARRTADFSPEIRGFVVLLAGMVGLLFNTLLGPVETWESAVSHVIVPALVVTDWLVFGGNQGKIRRWIPLVWLAPVLVYLAYYVWFSTAGGYERPYPFLNPEAPDFAKWVVILALAFLVGAYVVYFIGKLRGRIRLGGGSRR